MITERLVLPEGATITLNDPTLKLGDTIDLILTARVTSVRTVEDVPDQVQVDYIIEPVHAHRMVTDPDLDGEIRQIRASIDDINAMLSHAS